MLAGWAYNHHGDGAVMYTDTDPSFLRRSPSVLAAAIRMIDTGQVVCDDAAPELDSVTDGSKCNNPNFG